MMFSFFLKKCRCIFVVNFFLVALVGAPICWAVVQNSHPYCSPALEGAIKDGLRLHTDMLNPSFKLTTLGDFFDYLEGTWKEANRPGLLTILGYIKEALRSFGAKEADLSPNFLEVLDQQIVLCILDISCPLEGEYPIYGRVRYSYDVRPFYKMDSSPLDFTTETEPAPVSGPVLGFLINNDVPEAPFRGIETLYSLAVGIGQHYAFNVIDQWLHAEESFPEESRSALYEKFVEKGEKGPVLDEGMLRIFVALQGFMALKNVVINLIRRDAEESLLDRALEAKSPIRSLVHLVAAQRVHRGEGLHEEEISRIKAKGNRSLAEELEVYKGSLDQLRSLLGVNNDYFYLGDLMELTMKKAIYRSWGWDPQSINQKPYRDL